MKLENSIQFIRLSTGEDLISEVTEIEKNDTSYYHLSNPLKIVYMSGSKAGVLSISLMQWVFWKICDEQEFIIYPEDMITMTKPSDDMEEYYEQSVTHFNNIKEDLSGKTEFEDVDSKSSDPSDILSNIQEALNVVKKKKMH
jgi:hypothetical protein